MTWLNSAFRLMQFPLGALGVAIAMITLPVISRIAASQDKAQFGPTLARSMRLAIFLTLPAAVGLWFFSNPIIRLIYEHGKFHEVDSLQTAYALKCYALGLVSYACIKVLSPAFYAIDKKWTPMMVSFFSIGLNILLNYFLIFKLALGLSGLALSTSATATINFLILYMLMKRWHNLQTYSLINTFLRCTLASCTLGLTCWLLIQYFSNFLNHTSLLISCISMILAIFIGGLVYLLTALMLRVKDAEKLLLISYQWIEKGMRKLQPLIK